MGVLSNGEFVVLGVGCPVENYRVGVLSSREIIVWGFCPMENLLWGGVQ